MERAVGDERCFPLKSRFLEKPQFVFDSFRCCVTDETKDFIEIVFSDSGTSCRTRRTDFELIETLYIKYISSRRAAIGDLIRVERKAPRIHLIEAEKRKKE